jgi:TIR domain
MKLLDKITIPHPMGNKYIELYHGDLANMPTEQAVDILVVSAFPNSYAPTPGTLVCALDKNGVSLEELSKKKATDLREHFSCWLTQDIPGQSFRRILCFEPAQKNKDSGNSVKPSELVGEIFQSLMPFLFGTPPIKTIAMSLVTTGEQGFPVSEVMRPLLQASAKWLSLGLPVDKIKIVEIKEAKLPLLSSIFQEEKDRLEGKSVAKKHQFKYDLFISYSHKNQYEIFEFEKELLRQAPDLCIFLDRKELNTGVSWQQELYDALDNCRMVVALLSEPYIDSKVCKEEFNIAVFRHREASEAVLFPIFLYSAHLPTYMKLIQFTDCRENNHDKLKAACTEIIKQIRD